MAGTKSKQNGRNNIFHPTWFSKTWSFPHKMRSPLPQGYERQYSPLLALYFGTLALGVLSQHVKSLATLKLPHWRGHMTEMKRSAPRAGPRGAGWGEPSLPGPDPTADLGAKIVLFVAFGDCVLGWFVV